MSFAPFGAVKQLTTAIPVFGLPKRRPHFGGEGHSRGAKTDPVFAPDTSPEGGGLENEARRRRMKRLLRKHEAQALQLP